MEIKIIFCNHCSKKTKHINNICSECGYRNTENKDIDFIKTKEEDLDLLK